MPKDNWKFYKSWLNIQFKHDVTHAEDIPMKGWSWPNIELALTKLDEKRKYNYEYH